MDEQELRAISARFDGEMVDIYRRTGEAFDYWPNYFLRMVRKEGGVAAARRLLADRQVSEGFLRLVKARRLDLSVEYFVLKPRYATLFTPAERKVARDRLATYGFDFARYGLEYPMPEDLSPTRTEQAQREPDPSDPVRQFDYVDERTLLGVDGATYDVLEAIEQLPWVRQWCPFMPHEYAILSRSPRQAWFVVESMIRLSPNGYRAFFRGYQRANRYWEAPDGRRYWRGRFEIDRWDASDTTGLRRRDEGAHAIKDWQGPPYAPNGEGYYVQGSDGRWWPSAKFFAEGHEPCRACRKPPADLPTGE